MKRDLFLPQGPISCLLPSTWGRAWRARAGLLPSREFWLHLCGPLTCRELELPSRGRELGSQVVSPVLLAPPCLASGSVGLLRGAGTASKGDCQEMMHREDAREDLRRSQDSHASHPEQPGG